MKIVTLKLTNAQATILFSALHKYEYGIIKEIRLNLFNEIVMQDEKELIQDGQVKKGGI